MAKLGQAGEHRSGGIIRRGQSLCRTDATGFRLDQDEVRKRAPDVAADAKSVRHGLKPALAKSIERDSDRVSRFPTDRRSGPSQAP